MGSSIFVRLHALLLSTYFASFACNIALHLQHYHFVLPEFNKVSYQISINPVDAVADTVKAYFYKQPIRDGEWIFEENGIVEREIIPYYY